MDVRSGNEITVEFDRPVAFQIDGETILGVSSYTAKMPRLVLLKKMVTATAVKVISVGLGSLIKVDKKENKYTEKDNKN